MKLNNLVLLFSLILFFGSCSDDSSDSVTGTYILVDFELLSGCDDPELQNVSLSNGCIMIAGDTSCITFILSENGVAQAITSFENETETLNLTYTVNDAGNMVTLCDDTECNNFSLSGDELRFSFQEEGCNIVYIFKKQQ